MEPTPRLRVLVVDGVPLTRFGICSLIQVHPLVEVCAEAGDGPAARELCALLRPDLAVLDTAVPRGGGLGLLGELRRLYPPIQMLVVSADEDAFSVSRAFQAGASAYVSKSEELGEVLAGLESLVQGKRFASSRVQAALLDYIAGKGTGTLDAEVSALSDRELEIFQRLGRGLGATVIAAEFGVSIKTIETHQKHMKEKLGIASGQQLRERAQIWMERHRGTLLGRKRPGTGSAQMH